MALGHPAPTLSCEAGEGVWSPRPFGERGRGEGTAVLKTSVGKIGFMERTVYDEAISLS
jgi:hypothetical protein